MAITYLVALEYVALIVNSYRKDGTIIMWDIDARSQVRRMNCTDDVRWLMAQGKYDSSLRNLTYQ
jgi:endo-1,4-beta-mannosidase